MKKHEKNKIGEKIFERNKNKKMVKCLFKPLGCF